MFNFHQQFYGKKLQTPKASHLLWPWQLVRSQEFDQPLSRWHLSSSQTYEGLVGGVIPLVVQKIAISLLG